MCLSQSVYKDSKGALSSRPIFPLWQGCRGNKTMKTIRRSIGVGLLLLSLIVSNTFAQPVPPDLLTGYLFQDTNFLSVWGDPPLSQTNLALVPTWDNYGLQVDATNAAWLNYTMESDGYPNLYLTNGTLSVWVVPNWVST